ncbi:unnamed protein product [Linum trigynum]|uniref:Uncharacterized protein n=1 Tax=Linum trigynum TaxID=586398 RepID=A0AAV2DZY1_9ROSI
MCGNRSTLGRLPIAGTNLSFFRVGEGRWHWAEYFRAIDYVFVQRRVDGEEVDEGSGDTTKARSMRVLARQTWGLTKPLRASEHVRVSPRHARSL